MTQPDGASNPLQDPKFYKFISKAVPMLEAELDAAIRRLFDISPPEFSTPSLNQNYTSQLINKPQIIIVLFGFGSDWAERTKQFSLSSSLWIGASGWV